MQWQSSPSLDHDYRHQDKALAKVMKYQRKIDRLLAEWSNELRETQKRVK